MSIVNNNYQSNNSNDYNLLDIMRLPELFNLICDFIGESYYISYFTLYDFMGKYRFWNLIMISKEFHNAFNESIDLWTVIYRWSPICPQYHHYSTNEFKRSQKLNTQHVDILLFNTRMTKDTFKSQFLLYKEWKQEQVAIIRAREDIRKEQQREEEREKERKRHSRDDWACKRCHIHNPGGISIKGYCNGLGVNGPGCTSKDSRQECGNYFVDEDGSCSRCEQIYSTKWVGTFGMYICAYCRQHNFNRYFIEKAERTHPDKYINYPMPTVDMNRRGR